MPREIDLTDPDNPEWTAKDFARARPAEDVLTPEQLANFPRIARRVRGPQKTPTKKLVSLRLDPDVLDYFKSTGPGWQSRINDALAKEARRAR